MTQAPLVCGLRPRAAASTAAPAARRVLPRNPAPPAPPTSACPTGAPSPATPTPTTASVLDDDAIEAEVLAAIASASEPPVADPHGPKFAAAARAAACAVGRARIRAVHRPVMGPIATAKAG